MVTLSARARGQLLGMVVRKEKHNLKPQKAKLLTSCNKIRTKVVDIIENEIGRTRIEATHTNAHPTPTHPHTHTRRMGRPPEGRRCWVARGPY